MLQSVPCNVRVMQTNQEVNLALCSAKHLVQYLVSHPMSHVALKQRCMLAHVHVQGLRAPGWRS